jgi:gliding motility-associated-like protein
VIIADECLTFTVKDSATVSVSRVIADFTATSNTFFEGLPVNFNNISQNATQYQWVFSTGFQSNATNLQYIFNPYGTYDVTLFAENDIGCVDSIALSINIRPEHFIYVPNTFTPDGDRFNDYFSVSTVNIVTFQISILNRWGELVFVSNNKNFKWFGTYNGDVVGDSIYNYRILYTTIDGEEGEIYGHVNVLK